MIVPKASDPTQVRICVDMRKANVAIQRERHPTPTLKDMAAELTHSRVFSRVDLRHGYHQLEIDQNSRTITTFTTPSGLFRYKRLFFGICSAAEVFQRAITNVIADIPGTLNTSDDILVHGSAREEHDKALHATVQWLRQTGLTVNAAKCSFYQPKLESFGFVFGSKFHPAKWQPSRRHRPQSLSRN